MPDPKPILNPLTPRLVEKLARALKETPNGEVKIIRRNGISIRIDHTISELLHEESAAAT